MKVALLSSMRVANPCYSADEAAQAQQAGVDYPFEAEMQVDEGYVMEGPDVWVHCCPGAGNTPAIAEAVDDECRAAVVHWMTKVRPGAIEQIRQAFEQVDKIKDPEYRKRITELARSYGIGGASAVTKPASRKAPKAADADATAG